MSLSTRTLAGITVPDTPLITKAIAFAHSNLTPQAYNHVMRSWLTGAALISHLPQSVRSTIDLEAFAVSTILHDLGWSSNPSIISLDKCFEVDGANAAREFLLRETQTEGKEEKGQWDTHRIQLVWDAIALHTTPQIAAYKQPEVAFTNAGIFTELVGIDDSKKFLPEVVMTQQEFDGIAKEFPRDGLNGLLREVMCGLCRTKPETTYGNFVGGYGERFVEGYSLEGKKLVDLFEALVKE
ncbi:hypothetical protein BCR34DRAFT_599584 [Clohesyomyces aquaticus]|uniref:HD domain-containing protein n=1 Tax=Clohesyomyces aquaticus TaxID=1231657 RepID=A0A1Y1ZUB4_9PLEO|nr:hypothetical protein BCR34DRAFT_599584 [Clohesyomyces aquaticus]